VENGFHSGMTSTNMESAANLPKKVEISSTVPPERRVGVPYAKAEVPRKGDKLFHMFS